MDAAAARSGVLTEDTPGFAEGVAETVAFIETPARVVRPAAARAVAGACAANYLAAVVPWHRVVRGDGDVSGYRRGVGRKRALLEREKAPDVGGAAH